MFEPLIAPPAPQRRTTLRDWRTWELLVVTTFAVALIGILNDSFTWFVVGQSPLFNLTYARLFILMLHPIPCGALAWYLAEHIRVERRHWAHALSLHAL